jgi:hypothetical protein
VGVPVLLELVAQLPVEPETLEEAVPPFADPCTAVPEAVLLQLYAFAIGAVEVGIKRIETRKNAAPIKKASLCMTTRTWCIYIRFL